MVLALHLRSQIVGNRDDSSQKVLINFDKYDGAGVKVAIVDSGIEENHIPIASRIKERINFLREGNIILHGTETTDMIGHGTTVAEIILEHAPAVEIYVVKIFYHELRTKTDVLSESIRWAVDNSMDVINLSCGTSVYDKHLEKACQYAFVKNTIIVAAGNKNGPYISYPAAFTNVLGVAGGNYSEKAVYYYHPSNSLDFVASGKMQRIELISQESGSIYGNSFAAPRITGLVALIRQAFPKLDFMGVKELLIAKAKKCSSPPEMMSTSDCRDNTTIDG
jgi:thermitase